MSREVDREPVHRPILKWLLPLGLVLCAGSRLPAQVLSGGQSVALSATKVGQLAVIPVANGTQTVASIADGTTSLFGPAPVEILTRWDVHPGRTSAIRLVGYFLSPAAALSDGAGASITSAEVEAQMATVAGMPWTPFTGAAITAGSTTIGTAGGTVEFWSVAISGTNKASSRTDQLALRINLTNRASPLPPGTYAGTLLLRAVAF